MKNKPQTGWLRINGKMVRVEQPKLPEAKLPDAIQVAAKPLSLYGALHAVAVPVRV